MGFSPAPFSNIAGKEIFKMASYVDNGVSSLIVAAATS
jgi:hypothetical protein